MVFLFDNHLWEATELLTWVVIPFLVLESREFSGILNLILLIKLLFVDQFAGERVPERDDVELIYGGENVANLLPHEVLGLKARIIES